MLPMATTCHDSLISFEGLKGEQVSLAVPFRSPFRKLSLVWGGQCEWRASSKHPRCFQSLCLQRLGQYRFPPPKGKRMGSSGHETQNWMLLSLDATIQYAWKSSKKYYDDMCVCAWIYVYLYTHTMTDYKLEFCSKNCLRQWDVKSIIFLGGWNRIWNMNKYDRFQLTLHLSDKEHSL